MGMGKIGRSTPREGVVVAVRSDPLDGVPPRPSRMDVVPRPTRIEIVEREHDALRAALVRARRSIADARATIDHANEVLRGRERPSSGVHRVDPTVFDRLRPLARAPLEPAPVRARRLP